MKRTAPKPPSAPGLTPEQQKLAEKLTNLQRGVVIGVVAGKSQRQAYRDAGGKAKADEAADVIVSKMLSDARVKAFYKSLISEATTDAVMTRTQALERLTLMATTEITDILEFVTLDVKRAGPDGEETIEEETIWRMKDSPEVERRARAAIKSVTMTKMGPKIEMYDARDAMAQLAKLQGWEAAQKIDHSGGIALLDKEDYKRARAEMLKSDDC
jgi:phage terminase small subunit